MKCKYLLNCQEEATIFLEIDLAFRDTLFYVKCCDRCFNFAYRKHITNKSAFLNKFNIINEVEYNLKRILK